MKDEKARRKPLRFLFSSSRLPLLHADEQLRQGMQLRNEQGQALGGPCPLAEFCAGKIACVNDLHAIDPDVFPLQLVLVYLIQPR